MAATNGIHVYMFQIQPIVPADCSAPDPETNPTAPSRNMPMALGSPPVIFEVSVWIENAMPWARSPVVKWPYSAQSAVNMTSMIEVAPPNTARSIVTDRNAPRFSYPTMYITQHSSPEPSWLTTNTVNLSYFLMRPLTIGTHSNVGMAVTRDRIAIHFASPRQ